MGGSKGSAPGHARGFTNALAGAWGATPPGGTNQMTGMPTGGGFGSAGGWGGQTGGWQNPYRQWDTSPGTVHAGGPGPIGGSSGVPSWAQPAHQNLLRLAQTSVPVNQTDPYMSGNQTNPYMNMGKRFGTAEQEADYWGQDTGNMWWGSPSQQQNWEAGRQAYQDRLVQDEQNLMDRRAQWADSLSADMNAGGMAPLEKYKRMLWAQGKGYEGDDYSDEFSGSQYGMSDLERYRADRTSSLNEIQDLQRRLMELQGGYRDQYFSGGGRVRRR